MALTHNPADDKLTDKEKRESSAVLAGFPRASYRISQVGVDTITG